MADNTTLNPGTGGDVIAADDIGGVKYQRIKPAFGDDGSATDVSPANPMPVTLSPTGPAVTAIGVTNASIGSTSDAPASADSGSFSLNALAKRALANWTTLLARIPALVSGRVPVDGSGVTQPVSGSVSVSGAVSVSNMVAQGLTDAQLRATPVPVSLSTAPTTPVTGTFWQATQPVSGTVAATQSGTWNIGSITTLPALPAGGNAIGSVSINGTVTVSGSVNVGTRGWSLSSASDSITTVPSGTQAVSVSTLPLPSGAASETTLAAINTKIPASPATEGGNLATLVARTPVAGPADPSSSSPVTLPNDVVVGAAASIAALNTDLLTGAVSGWYDAANCHSVCIQIIGAAGISAGAITFEQTNNTSVAPSGNAWAVEETTTLTPTPNIAAITIAASTTRMFAGSVMARYVRVRVSTAFAGGNVQAVAVFSQLPYQRTVQTVHQATAANLAVTASGTVTANIGTGALAAGTNAIGDVGVQYRANATGAATLLAVQSPATPAVATIKASAGRLLGWHLHNGSSGVRSVKIFNATAPTLGTTSAVFEIDIPAGAVSTMRLEGGMAFATAITHSVTSAKGLTDNTATGLALNDVSGVFVFA